MSLFNSLSLCVNFQFPLSLRLYSYNGFAKCFNMQCDSVNSFSESGGKVRYLLGNYKLYMEKRIYTKINNDAIVNSINKIFVS